MTTIYYVASSLDAFIADADHGLGWLFQFNGADGVDAHYKTFMADVGAIAMGASTYEFVRRETPDAWPYPGVPTWVFTHRERTPPPDATVHFTSAPVTDVHAAMHEAAQALGKSTIWLVGGGDLVAQFARASLLDELHLGLAPVFLGAGKPLLPLVHTTPLELTKTTTFGMGFVELRYRFPRS